MAERRPVVTSTVYDPQLRLDDIPTPVLCGRLTANYLMQAATLGHNKKAEMTNGILYIPFALSLQAWYILVDPLTVLLSRFIDTICVDERLQIPDDDPCCAPWIVAFGDIVIASSGKAP